MTRLYIPRAFNYWLLSLYLIRFKTKLFHSKCSFIGLYIYKKKSHQFWVVQNCRIFKLCKLIIATLCQQSILETLLLRSLTQFKFTVGLLDFDWNFVISAWSIRTGKWMDRPWNRQGMTRWDYIVAWLFKWHDTREISDRCVFAGTLPKCLTSKLNKLSLSLAKVEECVPC